MTAQLVSRPSVLVASEDVDFCLLLDHILISEGYSSVLATDRDEALRAIGLDRPTAIVLDCKSGSFRGIELCSRLKEDPDTKSIPVVALIGQGAERDHLHLLKAGVDASFSRPLVPGNLLERLRTLLGGEQADPKEADSKDSVVSYADIEMNVATYSVQRNGRNVHLSPTEFRLLRHFLENPEQVISRTELKSVAWSEGVHVGPRTIDVHVGRLRKALKHTSKTDLIRTVRSVGYALSVRTFDRAASDQP